MKIVLYVALFMISLCCHAQKTKTFEVGRNALATINGIITYDGDLQKDTTYYILARDSRFQQLVEYVILCSGDLKEIHDFLKHCLLFIEKEDVGVSEVYNEGVTLTLRSTIGLKYLHAFEKNGNGFATLDPGRLKNIIAKVESFANEHKIKL